MVTTFLWIIGAALSDDGGNNWSTYSNLNDGTTDAGRYPSAIATEYFPMVIWNEYGGATGGGGGQYGGRAFHSWDEGEYFGEIFYPATDVHNNPGANDTWTSKVAYNRDADGNDYFNFAFSDWDFDRDKLFFHAEPQGAWDGTELGWNDMYSILSGGDFLGDATTNYTSEGDIDFNDDGIGYFACSSYWSDTLAIRNHTIFIKRSEDFGATWSEWFHLSDGAMNAYFWDVFPDSIYDDSDGTWAYLPDRWGPFVAYEVEILTDPDGNFHAWGGVLPSGSSFVYPGWSEYNGLYHFKVDNDAFSGVGGPLIPTINYMGSMQLSWLLTSFADPSWQANCWNAAYDQYYDDHLYVAWHAIGDTTEDFAWMDLYATYSPDGGASWDSTQNITNTLVDELDETDVHMYRVADSGRVHLMYQVPVWDVPTVNPPAQMEDYLQHVYYAYYDFGIEVIGVADELRQPRGFALEQNYPNPFNPSTHFRFMLPEAGYTTLTVYDLAGREVARVQEGFLSAGQHTLAFDGNGLASGTYFYQLDSGNHTAVNKMLLLK